MLAWQAFFKKTGVELELLADIGRGGISHAIKRQAKANNKYMKNYDENIESSYPMYLDGNNLCGWGVSQKLSVNGFKWIKK